MKEYRLAFDTTGKSLSVAFFQKGQLLIEETLHLNNQHSVNLLPAIDRLKNSIGLDFTDLEAVFVTIGPGSFTGIRIGISTANTFGYTLQIPVLGISSLEALAYPYFAAREHIVIPAFDARGGRVFAAVYQEGARISHDKQFIDDQLAEFLLAQNLKNEPILLLGDGADTVAALLQKYDFSTVKKLEKDARENYISAASIAMLGNRQIEFLSLAEQKFEPVIPNYCAITQAERNLKQKQLLEQ